ncbi:transposable element Tcb1 transposase [Trichonephila clavipes]|nr:transposable element Tcb1 transposase [Trichonephila clavipes]
MQICDRWIQEGTMGQRGRSHPPLCVTSRDDRQIVRMAVTDRSASSRSATQHIESLTRHSVSERTIRRLQQSGLSARRPLLNLPLTQTHRRLRSQWCDEIRMWAAEWNEVVFTDESLICLQHHDGRIRVWRDGGERMLSSCVMHRHTGSAPGITIWGGIRYHSRTPLVRIAGTLYHQCYMSEVLEPVVLPYLQGLITAMFQQDNARPHMACIVQMFFVNHQIELLPWSAHSPDLSPIENMWSMVAQRFTQITPPSATPDQLWQRVEAAWSSWYPKNTSNVCLNQCRGVWQR